MEPIKLYFKNRIWDLTNFNDATELDDKVEEFSRMPQVLKSQIADGRSKMIYEKVT